MRTFALWLVGGVIGTLAYGAAISAGGSKDAGVAWAVLAVLLFGFAVPRRWL